MNLKEGNYCLIKVNFIGNVLNHHFNNNFHLKLMIIVCGITFGYQNYLYIINWYFILENLEIRSSFFRMRKMTFVTQNCFHSKIQMDSLPQSW